MSHERFILLCPLPSTFLNLTFTFFWRALIVPGLPELVHAALLRRRLSAQQGPVCGSQLLFTNVILLSLCLWTHRVVVRFLIAIFIYVIKIK